ncbi:hypothetical protein FXV83_21000 [Bradyrhizobium hipponense]|uniref:Uncharacterized protein n=1 Tax=Bradyrhizobium hipponense TaxID=2605638 RepID=A0A5S4YJP3_9BRAD|nr:hypothetical protein FXV83_21000 [Bradyrhizobium hipponense]
MPRLVPGIHGLRATAQGVDGRDRPGHDDAGSSARSARVGLAENPLTRSRSIVRASYRATTSTSPSTPLTTLKPRS